MSSTNTWFVQTSFGVTLGPMSDEVLQEMAQSGDLLPTDLIRREQDANWCPAAERSQLFNAPASDDERNVAQVPAAESLIEEAVIEPFIESQPREPRDLADIPSSSSTTPRIVSERSVAEEDLISQWKAARPPSTDEMGLVSLASEISDSSEKAIVAEPSTVEIPAVPIAPTTIGPPHDVPKLAPVHVRVRERTRSPAPTRGPLFVWLIAPLVVIVLGAAIWFWPRTQKNIYQRYLSIWNELKDKRDRASANTDLEPFVTAAIVEVNQFVDSLTPRASSDKREEQLLLFVGRDCLLPILKEPRTKNSPAEKKLVVWLKTLDDFYASTNSSLATPPTSGSENEVARPKPSAIPPVEKKPNPKKQPMSPTTMPAPPRSLGT